MGNMAATRRPFVLLDRDGTLNEERHYLGDPDQLVLFPGTGAALRLLSEAGFGLVVITNQSGIGRGLFSLADADQVNERLRALLAADGAMLDGIYMCPHSPDQSCDCRKPLPGLVERAAADLGFDPGASTVIGDKQADIALGRRIGARTILVRTGWGEDTLAKGDSRPDHVAADLAAAAAWILRDQGAP
jgi:D-glycero-D-manno-heptose 1,7-bisphosphate phosphatase